MAIDLAAFRAKFPAPEHQTLADATDVTVEEAIVAAQAIFVASDIGTLYLAAHFAYLDEKEKEFAGDGVRASEGMGGHSESYRVSDANEPRHPLYDTTRYGRRYLTLKRSATAVRVSIV